MLFVLGAGRVPITAGAWDVDASLRMGAGEESDLVLDPSTQRLVVPGGNFVELTPALGLSHRWSWSTALHLGTYATVHRFVENESRDRTIYAQTGWANFVMSLGPHWRSRSTLSADFLDDSMRASVRRIGLGGELGLARRWGPSSLEVWGGARLREYPDLQSYTSALVPTEYRETTSSLGAMLVWWPVSLLQLRLDGSWQHTDATGTAYDTDAGNFGAYAELQLGADTYLSVSTDRQLREFVWRPAHDDDDYERFGVALRRELRPHWSLALRSSFATYTWPDGTEEDSHRWGLVMQVRWGSSNFRSTLPRATSTDFDFDLGSGSLRRANDAGSLLFEFVAPSADTVFLAGDFNDWNSTSHPLFRDANGNWRIRLRLDPGEYQYAYVVDGAWCTPPEATRTVEDGFGGRNGIVVVLPPVQTHFP